MPILEERGGGCCCCWDEEEKDDGDLGASSACLLRDLLKRRARDLVRRVCRLMHMHWEQRSW